MLHMKIAQTTPKNTQDNATEIIKALQKVDYILSHDLQHNRK